MRYNLIRLIIFLRLCMVISNTHGAIKDFSDWGYANVSRFQKDPRKVGRLVKFFEHAVQSQDHSSFYNSINAAKKQGHITGGNAHHAKAKAAEIFAKYTKGKSGVVVYDPRKWSKSYDGKGRSARTWLFNHTRQSWGPAGYHQSNGVSGKVDQNLLSRSRINTIVISSSASLPSHLQHKYATQVEVVNNDTIGATIDLVQSGKAANPVMLNMANKSHPGGGVVHGSAAQEEDLCRRSTLYNAIAENSGLQRRMGGRYLVPEFGVVYSPDVQFFRGPAKHGFQLKSKAFVSSVISSAAYNSNKGEGPRTPAGYKEATKHKIRAILRVAAEKGHDVPVLGAYGCGAFKHPEWNTGKIVSDAFAEVIHEPEFHGVFSRIVFAVIDDRNGGGNFATFQQRLHGLRQ